LQTISRQLSQRNTRVIVVSADSVDANRKLATRMKFDFPLLSDPSLRLIDQFGVRHVGGGFKGNDIARPAVFLFNARRQLVWKAVTDNWRIRVRPETILEQAAQLN
tara:strand:- start:35 stop:352 length:318 start_codon:yes stop_codon:yes gene_type:complete